MLPSFEVSYKIKKKSFVCDHPQDDLSAFLAVLEAGHPPAHLRNLDLVHAPDAALVELVPDRPDVSVEADTDLHLLHSVAAIVILDRELSGVGEPASDELVRPLLDLQLEWFVLQPPGPGGRLLRLSSPLPESDIELDLLSLLCEVLQPVPVEGKGAALIFITNGGLYWDFSVIPPPD